MFLNGFSSIFELHLGFLVRCALLYCDKTKRMEERKVFRRQRNFFFVFFISHQEAKRCRKRQPKVSSEQSCLVYEHLNILRRGKIKRQGIICRQQASLMFGICHECYFITNSRFYFALHFFFTSSVAFFIRFRDCV